MCGLLVIKRLPIYRLGLGASPEKLDTTVDNSMPGNKSCDSKNAPKNV